MRDRMSQPPQIVIVIHSLAGRGGERSVITLSKGFAELGCKVHLVCFSSYRDYDLPDNITYHVIDFSSKLFKAIPRETRYKIFAKKFDSYISKNIGKPDLILSNLIQQNRILSHSQLDNIAYIIRSTFSIEAANAIQKKPLKTINRFKRIYSKHTCVCVSKGVEKDLTRTLGDIGDTTTIYNAFDLHEMQSEASKYKPNYSDYIIHVGAFSDAKAHETLLKAYAKSSQKLPLLLLGKGKRMAEMQQLCIDLGIDKKVHFLGFNKNPYPYIKHATALVLSSRFEGFVRVLLEALALGTPVISTDCPSGPNEVLPAKNLVPVDDIDALASRISDVMNTPSEYLVEFDEKYLPANIAKQYLDYFSITVL